MRRRIGLMMMVAGMVLAGGMVEGLVIMPQKVAVEPKVVARVVPLVNEGLRGAVGNLAAGDFAVREAAQKVIDAVPLGQHDALVMLRDETKDLEVKVRLQKRIDGMEEELAVDPPALSLHVVEGKEEDVLQPLADQLGMPLRSLGRGPLWSFDLKDQSFADLCAVLNEKQFRMQLGSTDNAEALPEMRKHQSYKGFGAYFSELRTTKIVTANGSQYQQSLLTLGLLADPRVRVLGISSPMIMRVEDSAGNVLLDRKATEQMNVVIEPHHSWTDQVGFPVLEKAGDKIASAKGEAHVRVQVAEESVVVEDVEKHFGETIGVGNTAFSLAGFRSTDGMLVCEVTEARVAGGLEMNRRAVPLPGLPFEVTLTGEGGKIMWHEFVQFRGKTALPDVPGAKKLKLTTPTKTLDVVVPFELKDIVYPH